MQGAVDNCSFIAALSSVAWVTDRIIKNPVYENQSWSVPFYTNKVRGEIKVEEKFWLDPDSPPYLKYARSANQGEIWPSVYEKGYALYMAKTSCDMASFTWPGNTAPPLSHLSGWTATPFSKTIESNTDPATIFSDLESMCNGTSGKGQKIKRPVAGWTRSGLSGENQVLPDHAYSVLGVYTFSEAKWVVLRNPKGTKVTGVQNPDALLTGTWGSSVQDYLYQPSGARIPGSGSDHSISFNADIGIFALKVEKFRDYFSGYAWV
ncbi:MAG: C2 family cysteine protease [Methanolinea sp.]|nr:C2 family cysteine protease [Methanolinea sp.]